MGDFSLLLGNTLKAAAAAALTGNAPVDQNNTATTATQPQAIISKAEPYTSGDIPLVSIKKFPDHSVFSNYLDRDDTQNVDMQKRYINFLPTINTYFTADRNRLDIRADSDGVLNTSIMSNGFRGIGYKNPEQMFCYTLTAVIVEDFYFKHEITKKTATDLVTAIISKSGTFDFYIDSNSGYQYGRVKYLDEFGGPLSSTTKKNYLSSLLAKGSSALDAMQFYEQKDAIPLYQDCYKSVGGDANYDPMDLVAIEDDFLLNSVPEFRSYVTTRKSIESLEQSRQQARAARDNKVRAEQEAKANAERKRQKEEEDQRLAQQIKQAELESAKVQAESNRQDALRELGMQQQVKQAAADNAKAQALRELGMEQQRKQDSLDAAAATAAETKRQKELNKKRALESLGR